MSRKTREPRRRVPVFRWLLLVVLAVAGGVGWSLWTDYTRFRDAPVADASAERVLVVESGDSFRDVLASIREAGIREGYDLQWEALAWELGVVTRLQVGEYAVGHGITPRELLAKLEQGRVIQHRFTIVEGWTVRELRAALARETALVHTLDGVDDAEMMRRIGADGVPPEGRFLPETYQFTRGVEDVALLRRAYRAMERALADAWEGRADDLPIETPDEALVLASIIEKETGVPGERPEIAGVFVRRLKLGMRLQTDPTVIYGIGDAFDGNLTRRHLAEDTPYNTYTRTGLPPTPIALPGRAALEAAVNPADGDTLYFVSRGDGSHHFSRTLAEHNRAVRRYQLGQR